MQTLNSLSDQMWTFQMDDNFSQPVTAFNAKLREQITMLMFFA
jgi:hypothetical protein